MRRHHYIAMGLVVITLAVYWPVTSYEFVNYDDNIHVYDNPHMKPVTSSSFLHFWKSPHELPLTYTVWAILAKFARVTTTNGETIQFNAFPFHVANIIFHLLSILVMFAILRMLVQHDLAAGAGALIFALHPIRSNQLHG